MNFKTTYIMFGLLIVVLGVFGLTQILGLRNVKDKGLFVLPSMNDGKSPTRADDIETVELERAKPKSDKLVFVRTEQGWKLKQPSVRVESFQVERLIDQVSRAKKEESADLTSSLSQFGLETPSMTVTLTKKGGEKEWKLHVGNESPGGEKAVLYMTSSDIKRPMAVKRADLDTLYKNVNEMRSKELLGASAFNTSYVQFQEAGKEPLTLEKTSDNRWKFQRPAFGDAEYEGESPPPGQPAPTEKKITGVRELIEAAGQIRVADNSDFVAEDVNDADMAEKYGLETAKPAKLRIEVKRSPTGMLGSDDKKEPVTEVLLIGKKEEKKPDDKSEDRYYVRLENERAVARVAAKNVEPLLKIAESPALLRNRDLIQVDAAKTDAVDIANAGGQLKLRKGGLLNEWKLYQTNAKPRNADDQSIQDLLSALNAKRQVKDFPPAEKSDADLGLDKPGSTISIWVEGVQKEEKKEDKKDDLKDEKKDDKKEEKKEEKKDADAEPKLKKDTPTVKLSFGKREGDLVYVRREQGDDKVRFAVPATILDKVGAGPLAYLDRSLPSLPVDAEITKVVLQRDGTTYEIEGEKKDEKSRATWKFKGPKDLADRLANSRTVEDIIGDLRRLRADKLISEKAADAELDKFGLKYPAVKATLTLKLKDGKTEERTFLFGKETDDKNTRYAKQGEQDLVFAVGPHVLTPLQGELQDPTVFQFDPTKVSSIKIVGWEKVYKFQLALELERKSADAMSWAVKSGPMGLELDEKKVASFVMDLSNLKAERFLGKGAPKPEHKLAKNDRSLEIELTIEGEKAPLTLTIGDLEGKDKKSYYALSSSIPGEVFLVPQARFQRLLDEGAKYFTKHAAAAE